MVVDNMAVNRNSLNQCQPNMNNRGVFNHSLPQRTHTQTGRTVRDETRRREREKKNTTMASSCSVFFPCYGEYSEN